MRYLSHYFLIMNYKRYLVLEVDGRYNDYVTNLRIKVGMLAEDIHEVLDTKEDWVPSAKDKLYFLPGCTVPRFKVREKFKVTIKPANATVAFVSAKTMEHSDTMFERMDNMVNVPEDAILAYFNEHFGDNHYETQKFKTLILNCEDGVWINLEGWQKLYRSTPDQSSVHKTGGENLHYLIDGYVETSDVTHLYYPGPNSEVDKLTCDIYSQDAILKILNEGSIIIDEKKYQELKRMARSKDTENIILVMELMSNADYDKSFLYLLLLLKEFADDMAPMKEASHVNFKSLLNYFELDHRKLNSITIESLTKTMKKLGKFTRTNVQRLTQLYGQETSGDFTSDHYITGPVLNPELEGELDQDIISDGDDVEISYDMNL